MTANELLDKLNPYSENLIKVLNENTNGNVKLFYTNETGYYFSIDLEDIK